MRNERIPYSMRMGFSDKQCPHRPKVMVASPKCQGCNSDFPFYLKPCTFFVSKEAGVVVCSFKRTESKS